MTKIYKMTINKEQALSILKAGYEGTPIRIFDDIIIVERLRERDFLFTFYLLSENPQIQKDSINEDVCHVPILSKCFSSIHIEGDLVQIESRGKKFNHLKAINKYNQIIQRETYGGCATAVVIISTLIGFVLFVMVVIYLKG